MVEKVISLKKKIRKKKKGDMFSAVGKDSLSCNLAFDIFHIKINNLIHYSVICYSMLSPVTFINKEI